MGWWQKIKEKYWEIYRQQKTDIEKKVYPEEDKKIEELNAKEGA